MPKPWMIYGANGYTGELIAREAVRCGLKPMLAGRAAAKMQPLAASLDLQARIFDLRDAAATARNVEGMALVLHCAGPFSATAAQMMVASLAAHAHYLDITGEIAVFEHARTLDAAAREAGIVICPGVGFDVIPTDCVAAALKATSSRRSGERSMTSKTASPNTATSLPAKWGPMPLIMPEPRYRRIPSIEEGGTTCRKVARNCSPCSRCCCHCPLAWMLSPACTSAADPSTVTRSF